MEENKNPNFQNTAESHSSISNFRPCSSNSHPRSGASNSNIRSDSFNLNNRPSTSNSNWQERDKISKKRSYSDNNWDRNNELNKIKISEKRKKEENSDSERPRVESYDIPLRSLQYTALASQQLTEATMSKQSQKQVADAMPQQSHLQIMHQQNIAYPSYNYNASENYTMDPNLGVYAVNPFSPMMSINSQWPVSNSIPETNVATSSGIGISNGMERVVPVSGMNAYPYINKDNNYGSYGMVPIMPSTFDYTPFAANVDPIVPIFNNLKPIITTHAVLTPPLPGERQNRRPKPPGCKTAYVGNLPAKITEEIIKDIFKMCGQISVVRMNQKKFCHVRFESTESVEQALLLSGFRIRIDESEDLAYNGRLHVDYATARDDQHDYECLERARLREERHRQKEVFRPPSPPPVPRFSEHEAQTIAAKIRNEETLKEGVQVLITWLDRGECNKRNSGTFYSLIQSSHSHVKRLRNEKSRYEEEAEKAKENVVNKSRAIGQEINEIEKVFVAAKTQKVWDHFTRSQRKKMEEMKNDTLDLKQTNSEDLLDNRKEEDMEMSDNEDKNDKEKEGVMHTQTAVEEELVTLREKVRALTEDHAKDLQKIKEMNDSCVKYLNEVDKLKLELKESKKPEKVSNDSLNSVTAQLRFNDVAIQCSLSSVDATDNDSQLNSLVSIFLHAHPFGANIDYICSYLTKIIPTIARDGENFLRRFPWLFREVCTGVGATLEKKWKYVGFGNQN